jgi:hypothetical protein
VKEYPTCGWLRSGTPHEGSPAVSIRKDGLARPSLAAPQALSFSGAASLLGVAAAAILLLPIKTPLHLYDEGFAVFNAVRILSNDTPYKDFWAVYPPGQSYALALVFRTLGTSLWVARTYDTAVWVILVMSVYVIAARFASPAFAMLAGASCALQLAPARCYGYAIFPALTVSLLSIWSALEYASTGRRRWLLVAGLLIGFASLFRWDVALYALVSVAASVTLREFHPEDRSSGWATACRAAAGSMLLVVGALLAVAAPAYGAVIAWAGVTPLWEQVIVFPMTRLHAVRALPFPAIIPTLLAGRLGTQRPVWTDAEMLSWLHFYLPLATYAVVFGRYGHAVRRRQPALAARNLTSVAVFGALLFTQALSRYDDVHVIPTSIVAFLVLSAMLSPPVGRGLHTRRSAVALIAFAALLVVYFSAPVREFVSSVTRFSPFGCYSRLPRGSCAFVSPDQQEAIAYVRAHTQPDEPIFVGNRRHDLIFLNDVGFYFLAERTAGTRYHDLFPGVATTRAVQESIVDDLEASRVRWVVLVNAPLPNEPNASSVSSGVTHLDEFIRATFTPAAAFGDYEIWQRRPATPY